jgi:hypothetical protein
MIMKRAVGVALAAVMVLGFTSCENGLFTREIEDTLEGVLLINVDEPAMKSTDAEKFYKEITLSPLDNDDIDEYQDNIKEIKTTNVVATIDFVDQEDVVFLKGTTITFSGSQQVSWIFENELPVKEGTEITLSDVGGDVYGAVTEMLSDFESLTISIDGMSTKGGVTVTMVIGIDVVAKASLF